MFGEDIDIRNECLSCGVRGMCGDLYARYQEYRRIARIELEDVPDIFEFELHCKLYREVNQKLRISNIREILLRKDKND